MNIMKQYYKFLSKNNCIARGFTNVVFIYPKLQHEYTELRKNCVPNSYSLL